jgi:hypothetical protein
MKNVVNTEKSFVPQIQSILRHGFSGLEKLIVPGLVLAIMGFIALKPGAGREIALRFAIALPFIGFLWGLRIYEYQERFSLWKEYLSKKATLSEAFAGIANRKMWFYMIPSAWFCGIVIGVLYYFSVPFHQVYGGVHFVRYSTFCYLLGIPACTVLLLFGANVFGPKPDEEEELALDVAKILNQSPAISPMEIESPAAVERFINGAATGKEEDVKPYLWILSRIRPPQAVEVFGSALKNTEPSVRQMAVTYLKRIGGEDALHLLQEYLKKETAPEIRRVIEDAVIKDPEHRT